MRVVHDHVVRYVRVNSNVVVLRSRINRYPACVVRYEIIGNCQHPCVLDENIDDAGRGVIQDLHTAELDVVLFERHSRIFLADVSEEEPACHVVTQNRIGNALLKRRSYNTLNKTH